MTQTTDQDVVLLVRNVHISECGSPPRIEVRPGDAKNIGFFMDSDDNQWFVEIDREAGTGELRGGDLGWSNAVPILFDRLDPNLIVDELVFAWVAVCWKSATGRTLRRLPCLLALDLIEAAPT